MRKLGNLDAMLRGYFELYFIIVKGWYFSANLGGYFELIFVMADADSL
jgi:hypothetical protein